MTRAIAAAASIASYLWLTTSVLAQESTLATEGRGLLPKQTGTLPQEQQTAPYLFKADPSGALTRTIFETDEGPNFRLVIRDFSFPPDRQAYTLTLPAGALVHFPTGQADISIANRRLEGPGARMAVPAEAPIQVLNNGEYPIGLRAIIVEPK